jgi:hypothetical protein
MRYHGLWFFPSCYTLEQPIILQSQTVLTPLPVLWDFRVKEYPLLLSAKPVLKMVPGLWQGSGGILNKQSL